MQVDWCRRVTAPHITGHLHLIGTLIGVILGLIGAWSGELHGRGHVEHGPRLMFRVLDADSRALVSQTRSGLRVIVAGSEYRGAPRTAGPGIRIYDQAIYRRRP